MGKKEAVKNAFKKLWAYIKLARLELIVLLAFLAADLISKGIVQAVMSEEQTVQFIPHFMNFSYVINRKAAMGFDFWLSDLIGLEGVRIVFLVLTVPALAAFCYFMFRFRGRHKLARVSFAMIIAGTLGNFLDRLILKGVRDFIQFDFSWFQFIFNIADVALTVGVLIFAIYFIFLYKPPKREMVGPVFIKDYKPGEPEKETAEEKPEALKEKPERKPDIVSKCGDGIDG
jgi:signal peptidase II